MDRIVEEITSYASGLEYDDLPGDVVARAKELILDAVWCALGAAWAPPAVMSRAVASEVGSSSPATVMVGGQRTTPDLAAFANGVMIRYLDYNDTYTGKATCHPSDMLAPVLACVDAVHGDGKAAILGMVLGYEVLCGLADSVAFQAERIWDQATYAVVSASVAAAKLMGLSQEEMGHALSLAASSHLSVGQIRTGQISHWKGCAVANASRNAVFCAMLAKRGMTGPNDVFEGAKGFFTATGSRFEAPSWGGADRPYRMMSARIKPFPSGYHSQSAAEAVLELRPRVGDVREVKSLRLQTFPAGYEAMGSDESRWKPETRESADHSLPFVMAMALMEGGLEVRHYDEELYRRPEVRELMAKMSVGVGEAPSRMWPDMPLNIVEIEMNSGETFSTKVAYHLGHFKRFMSEADLERKFRPMAEGTAKLPAAQVDRLLDRLRRLEEVEEIGEVLSLTVAGGR